MKPRIAVISTPTLTQYLREALEPFEGRAAFSFVGYDRSRELVDSYPRILPNCDGLLVGGLIPFALLGRLYPHLDKPVRCYSLDYETYAGELLRILIADRTIEPERIYLDFLRGPITELLQSDSLAEVGAAYLGEIAAMDVDALVNQRDQLVADIKYRHAHGGVDLVLTRFATVVDELTEAGIACRFVYPGKQHVALTAEHLLGDLKLAAMQGARPGAIAVRLLEAYEPTCSGCEQALRQFAKERALDFVIRPGERAIEVLTTARDIYAATHNLTACELRAFLLPAVGAVSIGYGIEEDTTRARRAAEDACRAAGEDKEHLSFAIDDGRLIGPLGGECHTLVTEAPPDLADRARQAELSPMTLQRIVAVARAIGEDALTARILSDRLGVTTRAAARYLNKLVQAGEAEVVGHRQVGGRGRPEQLIHIKDADRG